MRSLLIICYGVLLWLEFVNGFFAVAPPAVLRPNIRMDFDGDHNDNDNDNYSFRSVRGQKQERTALFQNQPQLWREFKDDLLEGVDDAFAEQQWYFPSIVERALLLDDNDDDTSTTTTNSIDPYQLLQALDMSDQTRLQAWQALDSNSSLVSVPHVLSRTECEILQAYIMDRVEEELGVDNVDSCPDWQVNCDMDTLEQVLGVVSSSETTSLSSRLYHITPEIAALVESPCFARVGIFLRVYQRGERPFMPFHSDGNAYTVNIALNDDSSDFEGGKLLALTNRRLQVVPRQTGEATVHPGSLYHAVSAMKGSRRRYSMILFFHAQTDDAESK